MSSDGSSDMAANAWPGFVDILSAVVIMFVFFVLITSAVLYFYTITFKAKLESQAAAAIPDIGAAIESVKVEQLVQENQVLREKIESVQAKAGQGGGFSELKTINDSDAAQSFGTQASEQSLTTSTEERSLVLFHDAGAITVEDITEEKINAFIEQMSQLHGASNLEIVLTSPKLANATTQSRAKRLAVARMLNVRNTLLKSAVNRENIQLTVVDSEEIEESANWTRLQINILK